MHPVLKCLRIRQWTKNVVLFAGLAYSGNAFDPDMIFASACAFAAFCLGSSAVYVVNDLLDRERDRLHPVKKFRPIASRKISPQQALVLAAVLTVASIGIAFTVGNMLWALLGYFLLQAFYTPLLKHIVLLDVFSIAAGFSLRVLGGVWAVDAILSPWLVACTVQLALFLALCKRRAEVANLEDTGGEAAQRPILAAYASQGTDMMVGMMGAVLLVTYTLYTLLPAEVLAASTPELDSRAGAPGMVFTLPFVYYGVLRYLFLVYGHGKGERPERVATMDLPMILAGLGFATVAAAVIYF
ncbi:MAG: UbiA prenyltransferase family protein [Planctomycetes bacterium]|nr:UbiA prenyltransferase family protein [Planctomycetota bacterium]MCP4771370.1 UbiA prenyltransferase family protein [Planctomycetota bacterium]MCP4861807.1 UbiA prenyltransferase family protein [Planctomycetota bacterium]